MATIKGATNYCKNPSFETNTSFWFSSGGITALSRVTTSPWVGDYCGEVTKNSTTNPYFEMDQGTGYMPVSSGDDCFYAIRLKGQSSSHTFHLETVFYTSGGTETHKTVHPTTNLSTDWQTFRVSNTAVAGDARTILRVWCDAGLSIGAKLWVDGVDVRKNGQTDTYIDGDQGALYAWSGTAHATTSVRSDVAVQESTGTGGAIDMSAFLYRSNRAGDRLENLSGDIIEGEVTFDQESEIKMSFKGKIRDITELSAYEDYVIPVLRLAYADGTEVEEQLGHYIVVPAQRRYTYTSTEGDIDGRGLEWILSIDQFSKGFTAPAHVDYIAVVRGILSDMGFTNVHIPLSGKTLPKKRHWKADTTKAEVINALLDACNYTPIYTGRDGAFRSRPLPNTHTTQPAVTYDAAGLGAELVGTITEDPDMTNFANRVIVLAEDAQRNQIRAVATNSNPASPTSTVRLGFTKTITHTSKNINNSTDALALAKRMLERASRHLVKLQIETLPDPARNPYEVYTIRARQDGGNYVAFGTYACTGWTIGFTPQQGSMKHKVERLQIYE